MVLAGCLLLSVGGVLPLPFERVVTLEGRAASRTEFFEDAEVRRILLRHHIEVRMTRAPGSRAMANGNLDGYDFVFPSGQPAAELVSEEFPEANVHRPFLTPIVLATFRPYAEALVAHGIATPQPTPRGDAPLYYELDMDAFLSATERGTRWTDLDIQRYGAANENIVLAHTSDFCASNSAAAYLSLVAFTRNGQKVPDDPAEADTVAADIKPLLVGQGMGSGDRLRSYTSREGEAVAPIVVLYENQFLTYQVGEQAQRGAVDEERVLLYPTSRSVSQPQLIALTPEGDRLGRLIVNDPELRRRALELGYQVLEPTNGTVDAEQLDGFLADRGIPAPWVRETTQARLPDLTYLERMIGIVGECDPAGGPG
ncbi:hypothetical protein E1283_07500 [Streptomyces hainanensis]|uniref:ABC transporter substrate-binding protein n=2 Tax=Streptomyces hainanensis TaxID=402648 RepID=A0A4V2Y3Q2_9ACTN|nr:hypothetical protein E1283_07500 [Streptomyces hainanensis]